MLIAHLVPGYFAAVKSQPYWRPDWSPQRRTLLWVAAFSGTVIPDLDVIYNALFRGFINHSTLWTHSLLVHLSIVLGWWVLKRIGRWPYLQALAGLVAIGGVSHLVLDMVSHGTPLLYPISLELLGIPSQRVVEGGLKAYLTDPILLLEALLLTLMAVHWTVSKSVNLWVRVLASALLLSGLVLFIATFIYLLPTLQTLVAGF